MGFFDAQRAGITQIGVVIRPFGFLRQTRRTNDRNSLLRSGAGQQAQRGLNLLARFILAPSEFEAVNASMMCPAKIP